MCFVLLVEVFKCVVEKNVVGYAPSSDDLTGRIVLLRNHRRESVSFEKASHVVESFIVGDVKSRVISIVKELPREATHKRHRNALHCMLRQQGGVGVERSIDSVVGVYSCGIGIGEA